jgi:hypothetical protein
MSTTESEARKTLNRLRRALEKTQRELESLVGALRHAEAGDFPAEAYQRARDALAEVEVFAEEEGQRLEEKILHAGGLEPGRVRRGSSI